MKFTSTLLLKTVLIAISFVAVGLGSLLLPSIFRGWPAEYPTIANLRYPFVIGIGLTLIPFFTALYQAFKILKYIEDDKVFTAASLRPLKVISYAALIISIIYAAELVVIYQVVQVEDAPGLFLIWSAIFVGIPIVIAVFSAVIQGLLAKAITLKSENDLTV